MIKKFLSLGIALTVLVGCSTLTSRTTVTFDGSKTDYSKLDTLKTGEACAKRVMGFVVSLDKSITTATANGGISKVMHVDEVENKGFMTTSFCTVVYGK